jgi:hypothetical protein
MAFVGAAEDKGSQTFDPLPLEKNGKTGNKHIRY